MTDEEKHEEARHYVNKGETGSFKLTGHDAELIHTVIRSEMKRNWLLLSFYGVITVIDWFASYFTSQWASVALSVVVSVVTFFVGLRMVRKVITTDRRCRPRAPSLHWPKGNANIHSAAHGRTRNRIWARRAARPGPRSRPSGRRPPDRPRSDRRCPSWPTAIVAPNSEDQI
jgi:hypothetical protein